MKSTLEDGVRPGQVVGGYRIEKKLGAGGFGHATLSLWSEVLVGNLRVPAPMSVVARTLTSAGDE